MNLKNEKTQLMSCNNINRQKIILKLFIQNALLVNILTFSINVLSGQKPLPVRNFDSLEYVAQIDMLEKQFGTNKKIPEDIKLEVLLTLAYFPELKNSQIKFKKGLISTTLNARPTILSVLFKNKENRNYIVRINKTKKDSMVTYNEVPFNAKIGLLSHEFTHFVDYLDKDIGGVANRLVMYINKHTKRKYEHEIDSLVVRRKLGWQLYDWSYFVLNSSDASKKYKKFKKYTYLEPEEILEIMYMPSDLDLLAEKFIFNSSNCYTSRINSNSSTLNSHYGFKNFIKYNELQKPW